MTENKEGHSSQWIEQLNRFSLLILVNILPIAVCVFFLIKWKKGELVISDAAGVRILLILIAIPVAFAVCSWVLVPAAGVLRRRTQARYDRDPSSSMLAWMVAARALWFLSWIASLMTAVALVVVLICAILRVCPWIE